jgi:hypothetical protein
MPIGCALRRPSATEKRLLKYNATYMTTTAIRLAFIVSVLVIGVLVVFCIVSNYRMPQLNIDTKSIDLGFVEKGTEASGVFLLSNHGRGALNIDRIERSCTCFSAQLNQSVVQPGEVARLTITIQGDGRLTSGARVAIESNDPVNPRQIVGVTFADANRFSFSPVLFDFGRVERDDLPKTTAVILTINKSTIGQVAGLIVDTHESEFLHPSIHPGDDRATYRLETVLLSDSPSGEIATELEMSDKSGTFSERVPIYAYIPSKVFKRVLPIVIEGIKDKNDYSLDVTLHARNSTVHASGEDLLLSSNLVGLVGVRFIKSNELCFRVVLLEHMKDRSDGNVSGYVRVHAKSDDGQDETVQIPLTISPTRARTR